MLFAAVIVWALVRLALAAFRGLDVQGFIALVIVALAGESLVAARRR